eukprot:14138309-Ditylum_brightwellii.AAC.1
MYSDADLVKELRERRSATSIALLTNGVATHWNITKQGTIKAIISDQVTTTHRYHDVKISSVVYHKQKGTIKVEHSKSELIIADPNIKPHGGKTLTDKMDRLIGTAVYPHNKQ